MESYELIFNDISPKEIDVLLKFIDFNKKNVLTSHFHKNNRDIKFENINNLETYFSKQNTGNILVENIYIGISVKKAIIVMSFDNSYGDITINFSETEISDFNSIVLEKIYHHTLSIAKNLKHFSIFFGYEPAQDRDMTIFSINKKDLI